MNVAFSEWNRRFYDSLQNKDEAAFWTEMGNFGWISMDDVYRALERRGLDVDPEKKEIAGLKAAAIRKRSKGN